MLNKKNYRELIKFLQSFEVEGLRLTKMQAVNYADQLAPAMTDEYWENRESEHFRKRLKEAADTVKRWPAWKRNVLGGIGYVKR